MERYIQSLVLVLLSVVIAWTVLVAAFTAARWIGLVRRFVVPEGWISEASGPLMVALGGLASYWLWRLLRFVRRRGVLSPSE